MSRKTRYMVLIPSCEFWAKSCQQFDLWKPDKVFSIYSSDCHFVQQSDTYRPYPQLWMVLITHVKSIEIRPEVWPVKYGKDVSIFCSCKVSLKSQQQFYMWKSDKIFVFIALVAILCSEADRAAICTSRNGTDNTCVVSLKSRMQFNLWKPDKIFVLLVLGPFCAAEWSLSAICSAMDGTYHSCEVSLKSGQKCDMCKPDKVNADGRTDGRTYKIVLTWFFFWSFRPF
jgi:hypothetical protein